MSEEREREEDPLVDLWLANWEQQCAEHLESEPDCEGQLQAERDRSIHNNWLLFQNTATAIAQLYKDRQQGVSLWIPFQTAAGTVTSLYKDSTDAIRRVGELGVQCGYQRRNKELMNWARKKRRHIRREDLMAYLAGKPPPLRPHHSRVSPRPRVMLTERHGSPNAQQMDIHHFHHNNPATINTEDNMHTFREALSIASSNVSFARKPRSADLSTYIASEFVRNGTKRPASSSPPHDVNMDSPTHKRTRFM
ncbi:UPF0472 protein C16orf72 homolog isoform X1 [Thrips palmi]|uniref:UPF0472 protein C16orf72 homolog isoform X1 n=1 Tax=Thrips palmi TaxID=161013 RepID=A0A6P8YX27_THRPL|nr:UPF0472 protein C16orf72 homolog isoform X1 [Thrips palmi]